MLTEDRSSKRYTYFLDALEVFIRIKGKSMLRVYKENKEVERIDW